MAKIALMTHGGINIKYSHKHDMLYLVRGEEFNFDEPQALYDTLITEAKERKCPIDRWAFWFSELEVPESKRTVSATMAERELKKHGCMEMMIRLKYAQPTLRIGKPYSKPETKSSRKADSITIRRRK